MCPEEQISLFIAGKSSGNLDGGTGRGGVALGTSEKAPWGLIALALQGRRWAC